MIKSSSFLLTLIVQVISYADILFIDVNNSPQEIKAAQSAAKVRGEKLIVLGKSTDRKNNKNDAQIELLTQRLQEIAATYHRTTNIEEMNRLENEYNRVRIERRNLGYESRSEQVTARKLEALIKDINNKGKKLSSIIVSGHDGNQDFTGALGYISSRDMADVFSRYPNVAANVKSLFLAGCYTNKPGTLERDWKHTFPNLQIVNGYDGAAPLNHRPAGHEFIYKALAHEKELASQTTPETILNEVKRIIPVELGTNASICVGKNAFVTRRGYTDFLELEKKCRDLTLKLRDYTEVYSCYRQAEEGCEAPPENAHHNNPLREYYNLVQDFEPCISHPSGEFRGVRVPDGEEMIRLIYYKNVRSNYKNHFSADLSYSSEILKNAEVPPTMVEKIKNIDKLNRREVVDLVRDLKTYLHEQENSSEFEFNKKKGVAVLASQSIVNHIKIHLLDLHPGCVPFNWVEPNSQQASICESGSFNIGKDALTYAESIYEERILINQINKLAEKTRSLRTRRNDMLKEKISRDNVVSNVAIDLEIVNAQIGGLRSQENLLFYQKDMLETERYIERINRKIANPNISERNRQDYESEIKFAESRKVRITEKLNKAQKENEKLGVLSEIDDFGELRKNPDRFFKMAELALDVGRGEEYFNGEISHYEKEARWLEKEVHAYPEGSRHRQFYFDELKRIKEFLEYKKQEKEEFFQRKNYISSARKYYESNQKDEEAHGKMIEIIQARSKLHYEQAIKETISQLNKAYGVRVKCFPNNCSPHLLSEIDGLQKELLRLRENDASL